MTKLRVDIAVGSRFHAFDLARELDAHGAMRTLHTGYPSFSAKRFGLRQGMVRSVWSHEPLNRLLEKFYRWGLTHGGHDAYLSSRFDRIVARRLVSGADLFIGWSSQCRQSLQRATELGMHTIVERGSAHILWQRRILEEEAKLSGLQVELPSDRTIANELAEYELADHIAVPSAFAARSFVAFGVARKKLLVNPYGVNLAKFQVAERAAVAGSELRVIHVGRCSAQKGVHYLTDAVGRLKNAKLRFVGGLDLGIEPAIRRPYTEIIGPVPASELPAHYAQADVFCLLSVQDGLALVIAQAMACGLPVIVTANTGGEELITDGVEGFVVPARCPEAVCEKLALLQSNQQLRLEMGRRARARVQGGFSWHDYGLRALGHYNKVLNDAPRCSHGE